jgi:hypothetical protein
MGKCERRLQRTSTDNCRTTCVAWTVGIAASQRILRSVCVIPEDLMYQKHGKKQDVYYLHGLER